MDKMNTRLCSPTGDMIVYIFFIRNCLPCKFSNIHITNDKIHSPVKS